MATWIDFKELRAKLDFEQVLRHCGIEVKRKGKQHHGFCPLPNHVGKRNSPSFSANLEKGIFHCFGCEAKGNLLEFAVLMAGKSVDNGLDLRAVAIELRDKLCPETGASKKKEKPKRTEAEQFELPKPPSENPNQKVVVNAPLDFELKQLDPKHPYLDKRGFTADTIAHFGLGFCAKGLLAGRIAIPIRDCEGKLVGYCGRVVDDAQIGTDCPKYKFPSKRERNGVVYEFHKSKLLYNSEWLKYPVEELLIVEGFASVWWLTQMGIPNVVALMGSSISEEQAQIILKLVPPSGRIWIILDGDDAGDRCAMNVFESIGTERFIQWLKLDKEKQPTGYPGGWFRKRLEK